MITVVIIDDDPFVTKSLQTILESTKEIRVLGIGHCAKDALVLYETPSSRCFADGHPHA